MKIFPALFLAGALLAGMTACRSGPTEQEPAQASSMSLLEDRLLHAIEMEERLEEAAAQPDAEYVDIQRRFQQVSREYADIIARNPDNLEARLLYGKLLMRYGDNDGARVQFLMAARIDSEVAVIHQQLSTFYAEDGDYTRALAYALNAVELEPRTAAYHYGLGQVLTAYREEFISEGVFGAEQVDAKILEAFRTAADLEPDSLELQFRYGEAFYDIADPGWAKALDHWKALAERENLNRLQEDAIRMHRARCLVELGREKEAELLIKQVGSRRLEP